ncbi:hypothetical protein niasHT_026348 [Heterodera trifolii]|uniref:Uncharacterized protein n=1 Tax=Heterodera trifolii TaxID=157864 RepID=A0ABD2K123_9BILA
MLLLLHHMSGGEWINVELSVDPPNFFDRTFRSLSKTSPIQHWFGYNRNTACHVERETNINRLYNSADSWNIALTDVDNFMSWGQQTIELLSSALPWACFGHGRHSFVIFDLRNDANEVVVVRGHQHKIARHLSAYGRILFDHISARLYMVDKRERRIHELLISDLERWWTLNNTDGRGGGNGHSGGSENSTATHSLRSNFVGFLPEQKTDYFIAADHVYLIWRRRVYKFRIGHYFNDPSSQLHFLTNSSDIRFNFLIFERGDDANTDCRNSRAAAAEASAGLTPSSQLMNSIERLLLALMYLFDVAVICIAICAIRLLRRTTTTTRTNSGPANTSHARNNDVVNNTEMMALTSGEYGLIQSLSLPSSGGGAFASVYK